MPDANFDRCMKFVLRWEGGYVNRPDDPGGETQFGISKRAFPMLDIKSLTEEEARDIYRTNYWLKAGCDKLEWPLCLVVFDTAVNMGVKRACLYILTADDWKEYIEMRREFYKALGVKKPQFLKGWLNRCDDLEKEASKDSKNEIAAPQNAASRNDDVNNKEL